MQKVKKNKIVLQHLNVIFLGKLENLSINIHKT
jgi:hypothetical protein